MGLRHPFHWAGLLDENTGSCLRDRSGRVTGAPSPADVNVARTPQATRKRLTSTEIAIAGFRIPAGTVVTADPRIGNRLASLFPQPDRFEPERWVAPTATRASTGSRCPVAGTALRLPRGAWFPGGTGSHGCPGLPLAELCGRIFLVRWMQAIKGWQPADGAAAVVPYSLIPIRIPTDDYRLGVEPVD